MFTLDQVVPWGRSFDEYRRMFALSDVDLAGRIAGCGDGPAAFNAEATRRGARVVSCDPLYRWTRAEIEQRIAATAPQVIEQTRRNAHEFVWGPLFASVEDLGEQRLRAMNGFLVDYDQGKAAGRYVDASLPALPVPSASFDLALCSHFLFLYSAQLDQAFHRAAVIEMARVAAEIRVFPLLALGATPSPHVEPCVAALRECGLEVTIEVVDYEFQRGGNRMLRARRPHAA
jgi:hypothetical protein